jgi:hypothetical protein
VQGRRVILALGSAATAALVLSLAASAVIPVLKIATDPFTNSTSQHKTVVEPDSFFFGSTGVVAAQSGRFTDGGASGIAFARSVDNGVSYTSGTLPGITVFQSPPGPFARVTDPSVAHDRAHGVWMVSSLGLDASIRGTAVIVNRSTNGGASWGNPVTVRAATGTQDFDKNWTVCDNTTTSPFFGRCYTVWDDFGNGNKLMIAFSTDGGLTWALSSTPNVGVIGGQPVVQPNGNVVVPLDNAFETSLGFTISTNGGVSFANVVQITPITAKVDPGGIRSGPLPSAEVAGDGRIFVVWEDCRFRANCATNDLVFTTSTNGTTWTAVQRIPIDGTSSSFDHFIPGVGVDRNTSGSTTKVAVTFYFYPDVNCSFSTCQLHVGFISSSDAGATWGPFVDVIGPMALSSLPSTTQGRMVGDYISTSFNASLQARGYFAVAVPPTGGGTDCATATPNCDVSLNTFVSGRSSAAAGTATANDPVLFTTKPQPGRSAFKHRH